MYPPLYSSLYDYMYPTGYLSFADYSMNASFTVTDDSRHHSQFLNHKHQFRSHLLISFVACTTFHPPLSTHHSPLTSFSDEMDQLLAKITELTLLNKDKDEQRDEGLSEAAKRVTALVTRHLICT